MWQFHQFTLDAFGGANDRRYVDSVGNAVEILDGGNNIQLQIDDLTPFILPEGVGYETLPGQTFRRLQFINTGANPATVQVGIAKGFIRDARAVFTGALIVNSGDSIDSSAPVFPTGAVTQLVAADTSRNAVIVTNNETVSVMYVGKQAGLTTANGTPIQPGQSLTLATGAAVYGIHAKGSNLDVRILEVKD